MNVAPAAAPAPVHPEFGLWHYVWKLLRLRWVIFALGFRRAKRWHKVGYALLVVGLLAAVGFIFAMSWLLLGFLRSPALAEFVDAGPFLEAVPAVVLAAIFVVILLSSFGVLLQALYLAGDMDFLLSAPVPLRAVFLSKLLQAILPTFALTAVFALPVLFGLGASSGYNVLYYPLVVVMLVALALAAAGLASLLVMLVVRVFPARAVAEVLALVGAVFSIVCSQAGNFTRFSGTQMEQEQIAGAMNTLTVLNSPWFPLAWGGRGLVALGQGEWLGAGLFLLLALGTTAGIFVVALHLAERWYYTGWASLQHGTRKKKRAPARAAAAGTGPLAGLVRQVPAQVRGVARKDFTVLRRDLRNLSQLVGPIILGVIYGVWLIGSGGQAPAGRGEAPAWFMSGLRTALSYGNVAIALFVGWSLLSRLALMGFSQEGRNYWLIRMAPVRPARLLAAKFLVAYLPAFLLGLVFLTALTLLQRGAPLALLYGTAVVALTLAGQAGVSLAFGVAGARLDWETPAQMVRETQGCLSSLVTTVVMGLSLVLFLGVPFVVGLLGGTELIALPLGLALGGALSLACVFVPLALVRDRVPHLGET